MDIPFVDLKAQARELHDELIEALESVTSRGAYTLGPELTEFETAFAEVAGSSHVIGVSSGTDALKLALLAAGIGPSDEVAVPVNSFVATAEAVSHIGAIPVFVDCDPETALMDPESLEAVLEEHEGLVTAVVPVHLYGQPCDMDRIMELAASRTIAVVEDVSQADGATYIGRPCGSMGITAAFSFYPGKNLGALGDAGAVTTSDDSIAEHLRLLRNHGQVGTQIHAIVGYCDRMDNLQAAFLNAKLPYLQGWNEARRQAAAYYRQGLLDIPGVRPIEQVAWGEPVYQLFVVELEDEALMGTPFVRGQLVDGDGGSQPAPFAVDPGLARARDAVRASLETGGVQSGIHYAVPLHLQPAYTSLGYEAGAFPNAERLADRIISLPMFPEISSTQQDYVLEKLVGVIGA